MSIIHKVKVNNDWVTVKGGTSTSKKEIYIGAEEPTDENVKLWIDTDEDYEGGGGTSGSNKIYKLPSGVMIGDEPYTFSIEEAEEFRLAVADRDTIYMLDHYVEYKGAVIQRLSLTLALYQDSKGFILAAPIVVRAADKAVAATLIFTIQINGDDIISQIVYPEE